MAGLVEVLEVEGIIPHLINRRSVEYGAIYFELDDEHNRARQYHGVDSPTHTGDTELEKE